MKRVKHAVHLALLAALFSVMLTTSAFAQEDGSVWVTPSETSEGTTALIVTDTTVTDGVVTLTYDSSELAYESVTVDEAYVAMYSVNADGGVVRISWVAPSEYVADAAGTTLLQVNFSGEGKVTLSGEAYNSAGEYVPVKSTEESGDPSEPTEPANPTTPTEPANPTTPTEATPSSGDSAGGSSASGNSGSGSDGAETGDSNHIVLPVVGVICAAGVIAAGLIVMKRRGGK